MRRAEVPGEAQGGVAAVPRLRDHPQRHRVAHRHLLQRLQLRQLQYYESNLVRSINSSTRSAIAFCTATFCSPSSSASCGNNINMVNGRD